MDTLRPFIGTGNLLQNNGTPLQMGTLRPLMGTGDLFQSGKQLSASGVPGECEAMGTAKRIPPLDNDPPSRFSIG
eukprot:gene17523-biopygen17338